MTKAEVKWMEEYLRPLKEMGLVEPEEERRQWCFHIMVAGEYDQWRATRMLAEGEDADQGISEILNVGLPGETAISTQQSAFSDQHSTLSQ
jgi:hypothetical protein